MQSAMRLYDYTLMKVGGLTEDFDGYFRENTHRDMEFAIARGGGHIAIHNKKIGTQLSQGQSIEKAMLSAANLFTNNLGVFRFRDSWTDYSYFPKISVELFAAFLACCVKKSATPLALIDKKNASNLSFADEDWWRIDEEADIPGLFALCHSFVRPRYTSLEKESHKVDFDGIQLRGIDRLYTYLVDRGDVERTWVGVLRLNWLAKASD